MAQITLITAPSLIVSAKLNDLDPQAWLAHVLAGIGGTSLVFPPVRSKSRAGGIPVVVVAITLSVRRIQEAKQARPVRRPAGPTHTRRALCRSTRT